MFEARSKSSTVVEEAFVGSSQRPSPNTNGPAATTSVCLCRDVIVHTNMIRYVIELVH